MCAVPTIGPSVGRAPYKTSRGLCSKSETEEGLCVRLCPVPPGRGATNRPLEIHSLGSFDVRIEQFPNSQNNYPRAHLHKTLVGTRGRFVKSQDAQ